MALSKENEILNPQTVSSLKERALLKKTNDLPLDKGMGVEGEEKPFLPPEILSKVLAYVEQFTLIQADAVCHSFKQEGDRIWENRVLDLSGKLDKHTLEMQRRDSILKEPTKRSIRDKIFAALLNSERYKNVCLQSCYFSTLSNEVARLVSHNFKTLDLSHNSSLMNFPNKLSETLVSLNLSHCGISGPIPDFGQLKELDLSHNNFSVNPLMGLLAPALKKLNLSYNNLSPETVSHLKEAYKHLEILILGPQKKREPYRPIGGGFYLGGHIGYGCTTGKDNTRNK
jgi:Leucine-rich repeat (LRR) protein